MALFAEGGWTENHDGRTPIGGVGDADLDIVPITFNVKLEKLISGGVGAYLGGGLGPSYVESNASGPGDDDDWVFTAQVFAGLNYRPTDQLELFAGGRWLYFDKPGIAGADELGDDWMIEGGLRFSF